jgi:hypothetical protein
MHPNRKKMQLICLGLRSFKPMESDRRLGFGYLNDGCLAREVEVEVREMRGGNERENTTGEAFTVAVKESLAERAYSSAAQT